jgi:serine/threonine-protein kinase
LTTSANWQEPAAISPDQTKVLYEEIDPVTGRDIWVLDLPRPGSPGSHATAKPFVKTNFSEARPTLSIDGRWLAYESNESGRFEIYVRAFPDGGTAHQVSIDGGIFPAWSRDRLYFRSLDNALMGVALTPGADFRGEPPRRLLDVTRYENSYGVSPDGKRFVMMEKADLVQAPTAVALVQNFIAELRTRIR